MNRCSLLAMTCLVTAALSGLPAQAETLHLCGEDQDNPPYFSPSGQGSLLALVRQTAGLLNTPVEFHFLPWKRCLAMVEQGAMAGALALIWSRERAQTFAFPHNHRGEADPDRRLWQVEYPVYVHINSPLRWDGQQFSGLTGALGTPLGYISEQRLSEMQLPVQKLAPDAGLKLVAKARLGGYIVEREIGQALLTRHGLRPAVRELSLPFMSVHWYLVFSRHYQQARPDYVEQFWAELARQRALAQDAARVSGKEFP